MAKKKKKTKKVKSRDIFMLAIITANGGVVRTFENKKKKIDRKRKHKKNEETS